ATQPSPRAASADMPASSHHRSFTKMHAPSTSDTKTPTGAWAASDMNSSLLELKLRNAVRSWDTVRFLLRGTRSYRPVRPKRRVVPDPQLFPVAADYDYRCLCGGFRASTRHARR